MIIMFLAIGWPLGGLWGIALEKMIGGGVSESFIYPIYGGIILLTGLVVGCTVAICEEIKALRKEIENVKSTKDEQ